jgi:hypothetical protein
MIGEGKTVAARGPNETGRGILLGIGLYIVFLLVGLTVVGTVGALLLGERAAERTPYWLILWLDAIVAHVGVVLARRRFAGGSDGVARAALMTSAALTLIGIIVGFVLFQSGLAPDIAKPA